jgi:esterase/lipase
MSNLLKDWDGYYPKEDEVPQDGRFNKVKAAVRDGCHPQIFQRGEGDRPAIVLVHGLTDSPYFLKTIGEYFASEMGFDVYIPLLLAHGLKEPEGMKDASADGWKKNVEFAIKAAKKSGGKISIGGFSTGGTLSVSLAIADPNVINGGVFLFSAALGLASPAGNLAERLLRTYILEPVLDHLDKVPLVDNSPWGNPYRYSHMDLGGAAELSKLIKELDDLGNKCVVQQPLFAVHSEADTTAMLDEVRGLVERSRKIVAPVPPRAELFKIGQYFNVPHASIVLKEPVFSENGSPLESVNPFFDLMLKSICCFAKQQHLIF